LLPWHALIMCPVGAVGGRLLGLRAFGAQVARLDWLTLAPGALRELLAPCIVEFYRVTHTVGIA
jgi:hypothetical protein